MAATRRRWSITLGLGLLVVATAAPVRAAGDGDYWNDRLDARPTDFIFGYGSLISSDSREETVGRATVAVPVRLSAEFGYVRTWNDRSPTGFTAMGVRKVGVGEAGRTINGVVYPVGGGDMAEFDDREAGYDRVEIPPRMLQPVSWLAVPSEGRIWMYVPTGQRRGGDAGPILADCAYPILQSYVDVVVTGGLEYGPDFAAEILETTEGWSPYWLDDRRLGRRPWVFERKWREIDALLAAHPAKAADNTASQRQLPERYAAGFAADASCMAAE